MLILTEAQADASLVKLYWGFDFLSSLKPSNLKQEQIHFFQKSKYNPQFQYAVNLPALNSLKEKILSLQIEKKTWRCDCLVSFKKRFLEELTILESVGLDLKRFQKLNEQAYLFKKDLPDREILDLGETELKQSQPLSPGKILKLNEIKNVFEEFLLRKEWDWQVIVSEEMVARMCVRNQKREIWLRSDLEISEIELQRLIAHELETHVQRSVNGIQKLKVLGLGLQGYEKTEEGLAVYNESLIFPENKSFLQRLIQRYQAILFAQKHSFRELFEYLQDSCKMKPAAAWDLCIRVKRGITDTTQAGAFLKDRIYLQGYYQVKSLSEDERGKLYVGKIGVDDLLKVRY